MRRMLMTFWLLCAGCLAFAGDPATEPTMIQPLLIGADAPSATLTDTEGRDIAFADLIKGGPAVVVFYRGAW